MGTGNDTDDRKRDAVAQIGDKRRPGSYGDDGKGPAGCHRRGSHPLASPFVTMTGYGLLIDQVFLRHLNHATSEINRSEASLIHHEDFEAPWRLMLVVYTAFFFGFSKIQMVSAAVFFRLASAAVSVGQDPEFRC